MNLINLEYINLWEKLYKRGYEIHGTCKFGQYNAEDTTLWIFPTCVSRGGGYEWMHQSPDYLFRVLTMNVIVGGQLNYWVWDAGTLGMISHCTAITRQGNAHDILVAV